MDISRLIIAKLERIEEQVLTTKHHIDKRDIRAGNHHKRELGLLVKPVINN